MNNKDYMFKPISREEYHKIKWKWMYTKDNCPFCAHKNQEERIIWKWKKWFLIYNLSSYSWDHRHIMAVPYDHILLHKDLTQEHFLELKEVHEKVLDFFQTQDYFSFTRETVNAWTRSVEHLHMHFLVWELEGKFLRKMLELQGFPIKQDLKIN